jgi:hypothetical protein
VGSSILLACFLFYQGHVQHFVQVWAPEKPRVPGRLSECWVVVDGVGGEFSSLAGAAVFLEAPHFPSDHLTEVLPVFYVYR